MKPGNNYKFVNGGYTPTQAGLLQLFHTERKAITFGFPPPLTVFGKRLVDPHHEEATLPPKGSLIL